jgi:hypothetical protein
LKNIRKGSLLTALFRLHVRQNATLLISLNKKGQKKFAASASIEVIRIFSPALETVQQHQEDASKVPTAPDSTTQVSERAS